MTSITVTIEESKEPKSADRSGALQAAQQQAAAVISGAPSFNVQGKLPAFATSGGAMTSPMQSETPVIGTPAGAVPAMARPDAGAILQAPTSTATGAASNVVEGGGSPSQTNNDMWKHLLSSLMSDPLGMLLLMAFGVMTGQGLGGLGGGGGSGGGLGSGGGGGAGGNWPNAKLQAGAVVNGKVVPVSLANQSQTAGETVLALARAEIGVREIGNNGGRDVARYCAASGAGQGDPWCASFTSYIYQRAGVEGIGTASALAIGGQFREAFHSFGDGTVPKTGDALVFSRGGGKGHVGIISGVSTDSNGRQVVSVIEGNAGDQVQEKHYSLSELRQGRFGALGYGSLDELVANNPRNKERFLARGKESSEPSSQNLPKKIEQHAGKDR